MTIAPDPNYYPCGCLVNSRGAHRGDCPDYETVHVGDRGTTNRLDDLTWKPRAVAR